MDGASRQSLAVVRERLGRVLATETLTTGNTAQVTADALFAIRDLLHTETALRRALTDSSVPADAKVALAARVLGDRVPHTASAVLAEAAAQRWVRPVDLETALEALGVEAALTAAQDARYLDDVEDELFRFGRVLAANPELALALTDPALPTQRKDGVLDDLLATRARPVTLQLLQRAVRESVRGQSLDRLIDALVRQAAARRERVVAEVRVAHVLTDEQAQRLRAELVRLYGRDVQLQVELDPTVRAGVIVRIEDEIIDGSVTRKLVELRRRLTL